MKQFNLKPHEIGYLRLLYSTFAGIDYATANAAVQMKSRRDKGMVKTILAVQSQAAFGLASEYIRAALVMEHLIDDDPTLVCTFDPSDANKDNVVEVWTKEEIAEQKAQNYAGLKKENTTE